MLTQIVYFKHKIGEISCPTRYFEEASSIGFGRSVKYGFGVLATSFKFRLQRMGLASFRVFKSEGATLQEDYYHEVVRGIVKDEGVVR
jgi:hypothetical protein